MRRSSILNRLIDRIFIVHYSMAVAQTPTNRTYINCASVDLGWPFLVGCAATEQGDRTVRRSRLARPVFLLSTTL